MIAFIIAYNDEIFKSFFKEDEEMYEYTPRRTGNTVIHLIFLLLAGGFLILGLATAMPTLPFRWVFQLIGVALVGAGVFFYVRYVTRTFRYAIVARGEDAPRDLVITECQHKSRVTVCRLALASIERLEIVERGEKARTEALKKEIASGHRKCFSYTVNLMPEKVCYLFATECGTPFAVIFEPDETMMEMLKNASFPA